MKLVTLTVPLLLSLSCGRAAPSASDPKLVGGTAALPGQFKSTVIIDGNCTAAKVGDHHLLTASHCLLSATTGALNPLTTTIGGTIRVSNAVAPTAADFTNYTIESYWTEPAYTTAFYGCADTACRSRLARFTVDIALIKVKEPLTGIAKADLDFNGAVNPGDGVIIGGYGCEAGVYGPQPATRRLKYHATTAKGVDALDHMSVPDAEKSLTAFLNIITPGQTANAGEASICPGDSGGPVYRNDGTLRIVGVNSYYSFENGDAAGISRTNWHGRVANVGAWIKAELGLCTPPFCF